MLKIAIQRKGRLTSGTLDVLKRAGFEFEDKSSGLINPCSNFPIELLLLRDEDIPEAVETGAADLGIVGDNILDEFLANNEKSKLERLLTLPFLSCRLTIALPLSSSIEELKDLKNLKVATSYPGILKRFSKENGLDLNPVILNGSVEIATSLGMCDGILDLVSTGETLRQNGLKEFYCVGNYSPVLISAKNFINHQRSELLELQTRIQSAIRSSSGRYLVFNVPKTSLDQILNKIPSIDSPTLMELANDYSKVALHTVVQKKDLWDVISTIKDLGATGILSFSVEAQID